jgi:hypothetical protein
MYLERKYDNLEYNVYYMILRMDLEIIFLRKPSPTPYRSVKTRLKKIITIFTPNNSPDRHLQPQDTKINFHGFTEYYLPRNTLNFKSQK